MPEKFKVNLTNLDDIEIYELLLQGRIANFPLGFWANRSVDEAKGIAIKLLIYLIEDKLKLNKKEIKIIVSKKFITEHKLHTASKLFGRSAIKYVMSCYPQEYEPWQFENDKVPQSYWTKQENRVNALKYLFEVELKWSIEDSKEKLSWSILEENGLGTLRSYYPSLSKIYKATYQIDISPWEIINSEVPNGTWECESNRVSAVKWLIVRTKAQNEQINRKAFAKYGLSRLLGKYFCDNASRAVREALMVNSSN